MKDYYKILEVNKNASDDTIKNVFRMLIKKNHPDLFEGDEKSTAEEKVKEINEAYEVLISKEKRQQYDLELEEYNEQRDNALEILMEENEYLKTVIQEKNSLIKEFLEDMGINTSELEEGRGSLEYNNQNTVNFNSAEKRDSTISNEQTERTIYMIFIIIIGVIVLWKVAGINIFEVFIEIFKNMF